MSDLITKQDDPRPLNIGYYLIRYAHENAEWEPARWTGICWKLIGSDQPFHDIAKVGLPLHAAIACLAELAALKQNAAEDTRRLDWLFGPECSTKQLEEIWVHCDGPDEARLEIDAMNEESHK